MKNRNFHLVVILISMLFASHNARGQNFESIDFAPKPKMVNGVENPVISLNGSWMFDAQPTKKFFRKPRVKQFGDQTIQVPGEWAMQGFQVAPGQPAAYGKVVDIPKDWKNKRILLKCDGVYSSSIVFVNGKIAGNHEGGLTPFEVDLSSLLRPGKENEIIFSIINESQADTLASATQYAAHQLGGITRKIELYALPETGISAWHLETDLDEHYQQALLKSSVKLNKGERVDPRSYSLELTLKDPMNPSELLHKRIQIPREALVENEFFEFTLPVSAPTLWNPEQPVLYEVYLKLLVDGVALQTVGEKIGFREINVAGNQVFVNGSPIKLRGVNRHEVHPTKGRSLSRAEWLKDAELFKAANVNYIRTSHYPPGKEFVAICDSLGLFVELEAPMCWIGHHANAIWETADPHNERLYPIIRQQALETIGHYRNHPSIIIWSMANESAWGPIWQKVLEEINRIEPSRPVSFHDQAYGGFNNYGSKNVQIANIHYPGPSGPSVAWKFDRPLLFGEYAHLNTYNRQEIVTDPGVRDAWGRGLESMWDNMYYSKGCLGGAIWSGIDDVFYLSEDKAVGYGEWGPIDGWRRPKPEYYHLKKIYSPIKIVTRSLDYPKAGQPILIPVENRQLFTNLSAVEIKWRIGESKGQATADLNPGQSGLLKIWPDVKLKGQPHIDLIFTSAAGHVLDEYRLEFKQELEEKQTSNSDYSQPQLLITERRVTVQHHDQEWMFYAPTGKLSRILSQGKEILVGGPELFLIPLKTGPCNTEHSLDIDPLNETCQNWAGRISGSGKDGNNVYVEVEGSYEEADFSIRYLFDSTKQVKISYELIAKSDINPRQIGLIFDMPRNFENLEWDRIGQWSTYPVGHIGRTKGKAVPFSTTVNQDLAPNVKPDWSWAKDENPMGSNDFRATRDQLRFATLTDAKGQGIKMHSDGTGAFRAFVDGKHIRFLGASFSTAGGDLFFSSHLAGERQPLKEGDVHKGRMVVEVL